MWLNILLLSLIFKNSFRRIPIGRQYLECNQDFPCLNFWYGSSRNSIVFECSYDGSYTNTIIDLQSGLIWGIFGTDEEPEIIVEESENNSAYPEIIHDQEEEDFDEIFEIMEENEEKSANWDTYWDFYWR